MKTPVVPFPVGKTTFPLVLALTAALGACGTVVPSPPTGEAPKVVTKARNDNAALVM